ncbi:hypothetical protein N500_0447 [Wolbachia pipientis wUni]|nr:hypothetical protein N500_0447 [Wolbachia pipientis wUni]
MIMSSIGIIAAAYAVSCIFVYNNIATLPIRITKFRNMVSKLLFIIDCSTEVSVINAEITSCTPVFSKKLGCKLVILLYKSYLILAITFSLPMPMKYNRVNAVREMAKTISIATNSLVVKSCSVPESIILLKPLPKRRIVKAENKTAIKAMTK